MSQDLRDPKNNDIYIKWVINKLYGIKDNCNSKNYPKFLCDDFLEIYFHLIKLINMCENKKLRLNLKQELEKIKKCCDEDCQCIYRSRIFLRIFNKLKYVIEESFYNFNCNNKNKYKKHKSIKKEKEFLNEKQNEIKINEDNLEDIESDNLEKQIDKIKNILDGVLVKGEAKQDNVDINTNNDNYENKIIKTDSYIIQLDYDKGINVETRDIIPEQNTTEDMVKGIDVENTDEKYSDSNLLEYDLEDDSNCNIDLEADYNFINIFAYIYNLGEQIIKPGESVEFDQKPILSTANNISFQDPSSVIINESGLYDLIYYAQTEEKDITLALYINDNQIKETSGNTTSYNNTICSQGLILVPETQLPITITLRNINSKKDAIFNKSIRNGEANLSILIRKIS